MTLVQLKERLLSTRRTSEKSIKNLAEKKSKRPGDKLVEEYCDRETKKHEAIIAGIDADFAAVGIAKK